MELYLMQHGQAVPESENPEKPLSREGVAQIQASAAAMRKLGISLDTLIHSPKKRAKQTAALIAEALNYPHSDLVETELVEPLAPVADAIQFLKQYHSSRSVMIAGHLPFLSEMASALLTDGSRVNIHFENGGLCRLDVVCLPTCEGDLRYYLTPVQLKMLAGRF
jgi:phosphohistidine phosphatase